MRTSTPVTSMASVMCSIAFSAPWRCWTIVIVPAISGDTALVEWPVTIVPDDQVRFRLPFGPNDMTLGGSRIRGATNVLTIPTASPQVLLNAMKADVAAGHVETWKVDSDGDFKHTSNQMVGKAVWFRPIVGSATLSFRILLGTTWTDKAERRFAYSYYHGHMTLLICNRYSARVTAGGAVASSATPTGADSSI